MDLSTKLTPDQVVESKALSEAKTEELLSEDDPFGAAAAVFGMYTPILEKRVKDLSTGQLRRLVNALVQYPINMKDFIDDHDNSLKEAFLIGQNLLEAKFIMTMMAVSQHDEKEHNNPETKNGV